MNHQRILFLFTRTPLHVGAGSSVGAIDKTIVRERHTGFPVVPASSLKGTFSDYWNDRNNEGKLQRSPDGNWLFGIGADKEAAAGSIQFSEARLLAFPIRSARGSFAWITSPTMLRRAARDGAIDPKWLEQIRERSDREALFDNGQKSKLSIDGHVVLEEYTFEHAGDIPGDLANEFDILLDDAVWSEVPSRLVVLSDGMMSYFARNACEIAQRIRIDDETGTVAGGALFNQENVPSETLFYAVVHGFDERGNQVEPAKRRRANEALATYESKLDVSNRTFQFGGDASTGLGFCTVKLSESKGV